MLIAYSAVALPPPAAPAAAQSAPSHQARPAGRRAGPHTPPDPRPRRSGVYTWWRQHGGSFRDCRFHLFVVRSRRVLRNARHTNLRTGHYELIANLVRTDAN